MTLNPALEGARYCRRCGSEAQVAGFEPGKDLWTFPGGFVDLGETVEAAAHREVQEEIVFAAPQVHAFAPDEIPWEELAFWSTTDALKDFLSR